MLEWPFAPEVIAPRLLDWYSQSGRELPWRNTRDPYRIWLSEIMLQQTRVESVIGYFQRFLQAFPTVEHLAAAPVTAVIDLWAGLGYYARARNLHAAAKMVVEEFAGSFPAQAEDLQQLPGVGRSTAGAISALAFDRRAAILDGNVRRILCRLFAWQEPPRSARAEKQLWLWAEQLTPAGAVHDYTQAIMDLGATVCVPRQPLCEQCPLLACCQARKHGLEQQLPLKQATKKIPVRQQVALLLEWQGRYLVRRRLTHGFLGGLWEFPGLDLATEETAQQKIAILMSDLAVSGEVAPLGSITHIYSHFRLELQLFRLSIEQRPLVAEGEHDWCELSQLKELALHGAHKKALDLWSGKSGA